MDNCCCCYNYQSCLPVFNRKQGNQYVHLPHYAQNCFSCYPDIYGIQKQYLESVRAFYPTHHNEHNGVGINFEPAPKPYDFRSSISTTGRMPETTRTSSRALKVRKRSSKTSRLGHIPVPAEKKKFILNGECKPNYTTMMENSYMSNHQPHSLPLENFRELKQSQAYNGCQASQNYSGYELCQTQETPMLRHYKMEDEDKQLRCYRDEDISVQIGIKIATSCSEVVLGQSFREKIRRQAYDEGSFPENHYTSQQQQIYGEVPSSSKDNERYSYYQENNEANACHQSHKESTSNQIYNEGLSSHQGYEKSQMPDRNNDGSSLVQNYNVGDSSQSQDSEGPSSHHCSNNNDGCLSTASCTEGQLPQGYSGSIYFLLVYSENPPLQSPDESQNYDLSSVPHQSCIESSSSYQNYKEDTSSNLLANKEDTSYQHYEQPSSEPQDESPKDLDSFPPKYSDCEEVKEDDCILILESTKNEPLSVVTNGNRNPQQQDGTSQVFRNEEHRPVTEKVLNDGPSNAETPESFFSNLYPDFDSLLSRPFPLTTSGTFDCPMAFEEVIDTEATREDSSEPSVEGSQTSNEGNEGQISNDSYLLTRNKDYFQQGDGGGSREHFKKKAQSMVEEEEKNTPLWPEFSHTFPKAKKQRKQVLPLAVRRLFL